MSIKKSELYSSIWKSCDVLRGEMDVSEYSDYILVLLFIKYISEKYTDKKNVIIKIPTGNSFEDIVALKGQKNIGDKINEIISNLAIANNLIGILDFKNFNVLSKFGKGKNLQDRLSSLITVFENPALSFSRNRLEGEEILGNVFEYFINRFASTPRRGSGGEFFTPSEISDLLAQLVEPKSGDSVYDPACGSGLLLAKCAKQSNSPSKCNVYGQDLNASVQVLSKLNLFLQNITSANIVTGDTLRTPLFTEGHQLMKFDVVVSNPPFGLKNWGYEEWLKDKFGRNILGIPPRTRGDFAWILHTIASMKNDTGRAAIVVPHGVLFRDGAEQLLRKQILEKDYIEAVISLAPNLLFSTLIPISILVLRKKKPIDRKGKIIFINASTLAEAKEAMNNISAKNVSQIFSWYKGFVDVPGAVKVVSVGSIAKTAWNLNISHYIKPGPGKLLENAIVSIRLGLEDYEMGTDDRIISSIRNLCAGMLLLFKEKLLRLSPEGSKEVLIKSKVVPIRETSGAIKFIGNGIHTVDLNEIVERFNTLNIKSKNDEIWKLVRDIVNTRNNIEHYYIDGKSAIDQAISNTFVVISDFIKNDLDEDPRELLGSECWNIMLSIDKMYKRERSFCLDLLKKISWKPSALDVNKIKCSSCTSSLIQPATPIASKVEDQYFECRSCGQSISYTDLLEPMLTQMDLFQQYSELSLE